MKSVKKVRNSKRKIARLLKDIEAFVRHQEQPDRGYCNHDVSPSDVGKLRVLFDRIVRMKWEDTDDYLPVGVRVTDKQRYNNVKYEDVRRLDETASKNDVEFARRMLILNVQIAVRELEMFESFRERVSHDEDEKKSSIR